VLLFPGGLDFPGKFFLHRLYAPTPVTAFLSHPVLDFPSALSCTNYNGYLIILTLVERGSDGCALSKLTHS